MANQTEQELGFLQMCAERRFHKEVEEKFQELTGLQPEQYWIEASAGGTPAIDDQKTADHAYHSGATHMGWAAHGDNCGGYPGVSNKEMEAKLDEAIQDREKRYPDAQHYKIFSTEQGTSARKV